MSMVMSAIKSLKIDTTDGNISMVSNYIVHSSLLLSVHLALLFISFMYYAFTSGEMLMGTIIFIPQNSREFVNDSSNYTGIALSSIFYELIDNIMPTVNA